MEILRRGNADKLYAYFICEACGCEFKEKKGKCDGKSFLAHICERVTIDCPDCGSVAVSLSREEYLQVLKERAEADTPLPENGN